MGLFLVWYHRLIYLVLSLCKHACKEVCDIKQGVDPFPLLARSWDRWWPDFVTFTTRKRSIFGLKRGKKAKCVPNRCKDLFKRKTYFGVIGTLKKEIMSSHDLSGIFDFPPPPPPFIKVALTWRPYFGRVCFELFNKFFGDFWVYLLINSFSQRISKTNGNIKFGRFDVVFKLDWFEVKIGRPTPNSCPPTWVPFRGQSTVWWCSKTFFFTFSPH